MTPEERLAAVLPATFYAGLPVVDRVTVLVSAWQHATAVNKELQEKVEELEDVVQDCEDHVDDLEDHVDDLLDQL